MSVLADYDKYDYDYISYWEKRKYEHEAEVYALGKLFNGVGGKRIIDVGGSYGRLLPVYSDLYDEVVILDYSLKTLQKYRSLIEEKAKSSTLIAANAYFMPFVDNSFEGAIMVRVLHHLTEPLKYFKEQERILAYGKPFYLEIPNKIHLKARISALAKGDKDLYSETPLQQESLGQNEGSKGEYVPFLNFHPKSVESELSEVKLHKADQRGCSYFRSTPIGNNLPIYASMLAEKVASVVFKNSYITPSVIYKFEDQNQTKDSNTHIDIEDAFCCPKCKSPLEVSKDGVEFYCKVDNLRFTKKEGVYDFRFDQ